MTARLVEVDFCLSYANYAFFLLSCWHFTYSLENRDLCQGPPALNNTFYILNWYIIIIIGKISFTSPIVINVPTRASLAVETKGLLFLWLANLNNKNNVSLL